MKRLCVCLAVLFIHVFSISYSHAEPEPVKSVRQFTFNHSLWVHFPNDTLNHQTRTPYWIGEFSKANKTKYAWNGQFGHMNDTRIPPKSHLNSPNSENVWRRESLPFAKLDLNSIVIMPPNYAQWEGPENQVRDAQRVLDYVAGQQSNLIHYIYEHWPEAKAHNLKGAKWDEYKDFTNGSFHQWYLAYQNQLIQSRPDQDIRMIPVGPIITDILNNSSLKASGLTWLDLYQDRDPHGNPELYFLAGLVSYQSMFVQKVSAKYKPPGSINALISGDFAALNDFVWERLNHYNQNGVKVWP